MSRMSAAAERGGNEQKFEKKEMNLNKKTFVIHIVLSLIVSFCGTAQASLEIPSAAQGIWKKENGFVVGPEGVIVRLPIPENDPEALYNAGINAAGKSDWKAAIAYFTAAQERAHLVSKYMYNLALAHEKAGHDVMAISWYVNYLIADPKASNRSAVWTAIKSLEVSARKKIDLLSANAAIAADKLPTTGDEPGYRAVAFRGLASSKGRSGELEQKNFYMEKSLAVSNKPPSDGLNDYLRAEMPAELNAALEDNDLPTAERLAKETYSEGYPAGALTNLRAGKINSTLASRTFFPWYLVDLPWWRPGIIEVARFGRLEEIKSAGRAEDQQHSLSLAAQGRARDALKKIARLTDDGFMGIGRESEASSTAEIFLFTGDLSSARKSTDWAKKYINRKSGYGGWAAARMEGLIIAETGKPTEAIEYLDVYLSKRLVEANWAIVLDNLSSPAREWAYKRHNGRAMIAEFLLWRNKVDEALEVAKELDTLRQARLFDYAQRLNLEGKTRYPLERLSVLKNARERSAAMTPAHIQHIEDGIVIAVSMPGAVYDLDWCLKWIEKNAGANDQPRALMDAAEQLSRGIKRMRVAYERTGGKWGE